MALDHSLGLPAVRRPLGPHDCVDWDTMVAALEATEPWWTPGEANGYHMLTFGWTVGEIVRRVSGMSLGEYFRTQIAEPVGADFHIGPRPGRTPPHGQGVGLAARAGMVVVVHRGTRRRP
ncbi:MAG: serine hydrolase domain-containing protein [Acidimicrobiales bacterium]